MRAKVTMDDDRSDEEILTEDALAVAGGDLWQAVKHLYYSAVWHADRPVDEQGLWTAVRDAAGFAHGNSPDELLFEGVRSEYSLQRLRLLGALVRKSRGEEFTSDHAKAFLKLHGQELIDRIDKTVKDFLKEKLS